MSSLNQEFWDEKWINQSTGWDIGYASPAIIHFLETYKNKDAKILIPGCGNAYEAEWLINNNFTNITLIDISPTLVDRLRDKFNDNPNITIVCDDFFHLTERFDLIIEQTFFCALNPDLRTDYVAKMSQILKDGGEIIGLLFNKEFDQQGPPFGGSIQEYHQLFNTLFNINKLEECANSIPPRAGSEAFIHFIKK